MITNSIQPNNRSWVNTDANAKLGGSDKIRVYDSRETWLFLLHHHVTELESISHFLSSSAS